MIDTLNCIWDCTYNIEFPVAVEDLDVDRLLTIALETLVLNDGAKLWLEGFLGFELRLVMSKVKISNEIQALRRSCHAWEECESYPSVHVLPWHSPHN